MAYNIAGEIVFDDLPEYLEDEPAPTAKRTEREWDDMTTEEIINDQSITF